MNNKRPWLIHIGVLLFFTVISLIWTHPLIFNFNTSFAGKDDLWLEVWNLWWMKKSILELHTNPFFTDYCYVPTGVPLYFHAFSSLNAFIGMILQSVFSLVTTYNILFLSTFVLSGYGVWLVAYRLTNNHTASLFAGYIYGFSPYHCLHVRHLEHLSIHGYPFIFYFLYQYSETLKKRYILFSAIFFACTFLLNTYYGVYAAIFIVLFFIWLLFRRRESPGTIINGGFWMVLLSSVFLLPILVPMIRLGISPYHVRIPIHVPILQSLDFLSFFIPSYYNPMLPQWLGKTYTLFTGTEPVGFLGYIPIILLFIFILKIKKSSFDKFLLVGFFVFIILSLGPVLHFAGIVRIKGWLIPMPQMFLQILPVVSTARVPARALSVVMLFLSLITARTVGEMVKSHYQRYVLILLLFISILEYWNKPFEISRASIPEGYSIIKADAEDCTVMEIPLDMYPNITAYYQTYHEKRRVLGAISDTALTKKQFDFIHGFTFLNFISSVDPDTVYVNNHPEAVKQLLKKNKIKYIILQKGIIKKIYPERWYNKRLSVLTDIGAERIHESEDIVIYRVY